MPERNEHIIIMNMINDYNLVPENFPGFFLIVLQYFLEQNTKHLDLNKVLILYRKECSRVRLILIIFKSRFFSGIFLQSFIFIQDFVPNHFILISKSQTSSSIFGSSRQLLSFPGSFSGFFHHSSTTFSRLFYTIGCR